MEGMYKLVSVGTNGERHVCTGTFMKCLRRGQRLWKRMAMRGTITRPDSSNLREPYKRVSFPG